MLILVSATTPRHIEVYKRQTFISKTVLLSLFVSASKVRSHVSNVSLTFLWVLSSWLVTGVLRAPVQPIPFIGTHASRA